MRKTPPTAMPALDKRKGLVELLKGKARLRLDLAVDEGGNVDDDVDDKGVEAGEAKVGVLAEARPVEGVVGIAAGDRLQDGSAVGGRGPSLKGKWGRWKWTTEVWVRAWAHAPSSRRTVPGGCWPEAEDQVFPPSSSIMAKFGTNLLDVSMKRSVQDSKTSTLIIGNLYMLYNNSCMFLYPSTPSIRTSDTKQRQTRVVSLSGEVDVATKLAGARQTYRELHYTRYHLRTLIS